jgi:hypothetical protein
VNNELFEESLEQFVVRAFFLRHAALLLTCYSDLVADSSSIMISSELSRVFAFAKKTGREVYKEQATLPDRLDLSRPTIQRDVPRERRDCN